MKFYTTARKYGSKALVVAAAAAASTGAFAAGNPIVDMIDAISLDGVAAAVAAICLVIVAIALTFKGPDVAKRVIRKV